MATAVKAMPRVIRLVIPCTPPSVNTYVRHTRRGHHYVSPEAKGFWERMRMIVIDERLVQATWKFHTVRINIFLGRGERLDVDNGMKVVLDGLMKCRVIETDAHVVRIEAEKGRDAINPRTEIEICEHLPR